ncbi:MAG TPA: aldehyde dehydrogenase family protein [Candidatus Bathyarchaeia archaeon]|nr:aldehyde dehydrogenase family protein [Candidatus Bathyarchaeia archaeon]
MNHRMYVGGKWVGARDGRSYSIPNPATEEPIGTAPQATLEDMRQAIAVARAAFDDGPWPRMSREERRRILWQIADGMERNRKRLCDIVIAESAATHDMLWVQVDKPIEYMRNYAELAVSFDYEEMLPVAQASFRGFPLDINGMAYHAPVGVCGLVPTWNVPLHVTVEKVGPALATGCTMVVKPSPYAPLANLELARIIDETDLPKGVFNVVTGEGTDIARELVSHPMIDKVSFTGSVATGKAIARAAADTLKRVHLELGGKSANIVLEDAPLELIGAGLAGPAVTQAGQGCVMTTRVLVPARHHDRLVADMVSFVKLARIGNPVDPEVTMPPLIREERRGKVEEYIESGRQQGAVLATGGGRPPGLPRGYFLEPTIFAAADNAMRIAREEIFGPVVTVIPYRDEEEAIRIANDSSYGLGASIVTANKVRGRELAKRLRVGSVLIGTMPNLTHSPFGGFKESGIGREGGKWGILDYSEICAINWG